MYINDCSDTDIIGNSDSGKATTFDDVIEV